MSVYFIQNGSHIKIGVSVAPWSRLASLQTAHPEPLHMLAIMPGGTEEERDLHLRFTEYRASGEWFRDNDGLRQFIQEVRSLHPDLQEMPGTSSPERLAPIQPRRFDNQAVEAACARLDGFRQCGGMVEVYEYPDKFIVGLPDTHYVGGHDPTKLYAVNYDDGQITPKIDREMKPRTLTNRLNEAMMYISYFIKPVVCFRQGYGLFLRFDTAAAAAVETAAAEAQP